MNYLTKNTPIINGEGFVLRHLSISDAPRLVEITKNPEVIKYITLTKPCTLTEEQYFISKNLKDIETNEKPNILIWAIEINSQLAGMISVRRTKENTKKATLGYTLDQPYWSRGIMTQSVRLISSHAFTETDIDTLQISAFSPNQGSQRVAIKSDFKQCGYSRNAYTKGDQVFDMVYFELTKEEWQQA